MANRTWQPIKDGGTKGRLAAKFESTGATESREYCRDGADFNREIDSAGPRGCRQIRRASRGFTKAYVCCVVGISKTH